MAVLPRRFYQRDAARVARELLGKTLVGPVDGQRRSARIVETEAYVGPHDLASHSRHGPTARNAAMFGRAGHAYVYFVYGLHHCFNVVCGAKDGQAVLVRAAEPLHGWTARLCGPALLAKGFGLTRAQDGADLTSGPLRLLDAPATRRIVTTPRIGVAYAKEWALQPLRFLDADSAAVSARRAFKVEGVRGAP